LRKGEGGVQGWVLRGRGRGTGMGTEREREGKAGEGEGGTGRRGSTEISTGREW